MQAAQEGSDLLPSIGLVNVYTLFYPEHIILGDDIYHRARYAIMDIEFDDEALALEAIAEVGPGGHFLGHKHTRRHMREAVKPAITHQPGPTAPSATPRGGAASKRRAAKSRGATTGRGSHLRRPDKARRSSTMDPRGAPTPSCAAGGRGPRSGRDP